jgi:hypothetical protein
MGKKKKTTNRGKLAINFLKGLVKLPTDYFTRRGISGASVRNPLSKKQNQ